MMDVETGSLQKKLEQELQHYENDDPDEIEVICVLVSALKAVRSCASSILVLIDDEITDLIVKTMDAGIDVKRQDLWETKDFLLDKVRKKLLVGSDSPSKEDTKK